MKVNGLPLITDDTDEYTVVPDGIVVMTEPPKPENILRLMTLDELRKKLKRA